MLENLKEEVCKANLKLFEYGLITLTWGNVSGVDRESGLMVIKPSGVSYDSMKPSDMVVVRLSDGKKVEGEYRPSSDTPTHIELYRAFPEIGGVVHTHSTYATAFAQQRLSIPAMGTTHADHFKGDIPCTRELTDDEIRGEYEKNTGLVIEETFRNIDENAIPSVLVASHGVFSWGKNAFSAVENALVTERVAQTVAIGKVIGGNSTPVGNVLLDKHYLRKHGKNAYYGQEIRNDVEKKFDSLIKSLTGLCSCGKSHSVGLKKMYMHSGAISKLPDVINDLGNFEKIAVICDENTYTAAGKRVCELVKTDCTVILDSENLHANEIAVSKAKDELCDDCDLLLATGSGTVHDITRYIAYERNIPFISVPTAASVDGFVSTVAAMTWNGVKRTFTAVGPLAMVADSDIIAKSPKKMTAAGVGDLLGKFTAIADWRISHILTGEHICNEIIALEEEALHQVIANIDNIAKGDIASVEELMYGLVLSGLAMQMAGNSRPASGSEHHISHLIEMAVICPPNFALHGEKVGIATGIVCDRYHDFEKILDRESFSPENGWSEEELQNVFGDLFDEIKKENAVDVMDGVTVKSIKEHRSEILDVINALPSGDDIRILIKKVSGSTTLKEINLPCDMLPEIIRFSPAIRRRLTLMRILTYFN